MNSDLQISFFDCCDTSQESTITVKGTAHSRYRYVENAARRLTRWITVTAAKVCRKIVRRISAFILKHFRSQGRSVLRNSEILRI